MKNSFSEQSSILATLHLEKKNYRLGEPIFLEFRIENQSAEVVIISSRIMVPNYLHIIITDENGKEVKYVGRVYKLPVISFSEFIILLPKHFYGKKFDITGKEQGFELNKPGTYTITGYYENNDRDELLQITSSDEIKKRFGYSAEKIWAGKINLPSIKFTILEDSKKKR